MAFPTVESVVETTFPISQSTHNVAMPATVNAGDLLVVHFFADQNYFDESVPAPSGWTGYGWTWFNGSTPRGGSWAKDADGTEGGTTVNFSTASPCIGYAQCYRISAWGGTLATDVDVSTVDYGESAAPNPPAATAGWGSDDNLWMAVAGIHGDDAFTADPTGYGDPTSGGDGTLVAGRSVYRQLASASDDPSAFALSAARRYGAWTLVIKPSGAAAIPASVDGVAADMGFIDATPQTQTSIKVTIVNDKLHFFWEAMPGVVATSGVGAAVAVAGKVATIQFDIATGGITIISEGDLPVNTFVPPTYRVSFNDDNPGGPSLMSWYSFEVGYTVLITDSVATPYPGQTVPRNSELLAADAGSGDGGKAVFTNGSTYLVTDGEKTILEAAGYTVS